MIDSFVQEDVISFEEMDELLEREFMSAPYNAYAVYKLKPGKQYEKLAYTEMDFLQANKHKYIMQIREAICKINEFAFETQEQIEMFLRLEGYNVVSSGAKGCITLQDPVYLLKGRIRLRQEGDTLRATGYDRKGLERSLVQRQNYLVAGYDAVPEQYEKTKCGCVILEGLCFDNMIYPTNNMPDIERGDVIALKRNGHIRYFYVDECGYVTVHFRERNEGEN